MQYGTKSRIQLVPVTPKYEGEADDGQQQQVDLENPAIRTAIQQAVDEATQGLKAKRDEILGEKRDLKAKYDALAKQWEGFDPEAVRGLMEKIANDEDTKLIAEGKSDVVIERRTEAMRRDAEMKVTKAVERAEAAEATVKEKDAKIAELIIDATVRDAAAEAEIQKSALPDVLLRARSIFALNDEYEIEARKPDGTMIVGKEGKGSMTPAEWLVDVMKTEAPHWWAPSNGGGLQSGRQGGAPKGGEDIEKLSPREKLTHGLRQQR